MESVHGEGEEIASAHLNVNRGLSALAKAVNCRILERVNDFYDNDERIEYLNCFNDMQEDDYKSPMCWTMKPITGEDYNYHGDNKPWTARIPQIKVKALKAVLDHYSVNDKIDTWYSISFWIKDADDIGCLTGVTLRREVIE